MHIWSHSVPSFFRGQHRKCETQTSLLLEYRLIITIELLEIFLFKLTLNGPERFSECAPLFRSFPWASQVATEMSRTAAGWKQPRSNRWACGKKLWSLIIKAELWLSEPPPLRAGRHQLKGGKVWLSYAGLGRDYCFHNEGKLRHYIGLSYWLLCLIDRCDWHLAALCVLCKGRSESRLVCPSVWVLQGLVCPLWRQIFAASPYSSCFFPVPLMRCWPLQGQTWS